MKKQLLSFLLVLLTAISAAAYNFEVDGIYYYCRTLSSTTVEVTCQDYWSGGYSGSVLIPETVNYSGKNYSVTSIGDHAFYGCINLTSVTIPNSVTSLGEEAFSGCSGLTEIIIPNSVTSLGKETFSGCTGLTEITIPNSIIGIGTRVFSGCSGLTSVTIPNSVTHIGSYSFSGCGGLTEITIPNSVTHIMDYAFSGCSGLTEVTIPNSVTHIMDYAFSGCSGLTEVTCLVEEPSKITMGSGVFKNVQTSTCTLHVPYGSNGLYETAEQWKEFGNIIEIIHPGDVNGDGVYSAVDVSMVVSYVLGQDPEGGIREAADMNGDGSITAVDVSLVVSYILSSHSI